MQQRLFIDKYDIETITGLYIVEVDKTNFDTSLIQNGEISSFYIEKRISQITLVKEGKQNKYCLTGFFYPHSQLLTLEELLERINNSNRFYRLLTPEELGLVYKKFFKLRFKYANSSRDRLKDREK